MGEWRRRGTAWWETSVVNCSLCGQMIPRDVWVSDEGLGFCDAECEQLYRSYWVPRHGPRPPTPRPPGGGVGGSP